MQFLIPQLEQAYHRRRLNSREHFLRIYFISCWRSDLVSLTILIRLQLSFDLVDPDRGLAIRRLLNFKIILLFYHEVGITKRQLRHLAYIVVFEIRRWLTPSILRLWPLVFKIQCDHILLRIGDDWVFLTLVFKEIIVWVSLQVHKVIVVFGVHGRAWWNHLVWGVMLRCVLIWFGFADLNVNKVHIHFFCRQKGGWVNSFV